MKFSTSANEVIMKKVLCVGIGGGISRAEAHVGA